MPEDASRSPLYGAARSSRDESGTNVVLAEQFSKPLKPEMERLIKGGSSRPDWRNGCRNEREGDGQGGTGFIWSNDHEMK